MPLAATAHAAGRTGSDPISPLKEAARDRKPASSLTQEDQTRLNEIQSRDREVRAHDRTHKTAGGRHAGAASLDHQKGTDGKRHVIAGELPVKASPVPGDPEETVAKMEFIRSTALAPAHPSAQDKAIAQAAQSQILDAEAKIRKQEKERLESDRADRAAAAEDAERQHASDDLRAEKSETQQLERARSTELVRAEVSEVEQAESESYDDEVLKAELLDDARADQEASKRIYLRPAGRAHPDPVFVRDQAAQAYAQLNDFIAKEAEPGALQP